MSIAEVMENPKNWVIVDKAVFQKMQKANNPRVKRLFCSRSDVLTILDIDDKKLAKLLKEPDTRLKPTKIRGKYLLKSVYDEAERLTK